jgi:hypothetical protein
MLVFSTWITSVYILESRGARSIIHLGPCKLHSKRGWCDRWEGRCGRLHVNLFNLWNWHVYLINLFLILMEPWHCIKWLIWKGFMNCHLFKDLVVQILIVIIVFMHFFLVIRSFPFWIHTVLDFWIVIFNSYWRRHTFKTPRSAIEKVICLCSVIVYSVSLMLNCCKPLFSFLSLSLGYFKVWKNILIHLLYVIYERLHFVPLLIYSLFSLVKLRTPR